MNSLRDGCPYIIRLAEGLYGKTRGYMGLGFRVKGLGFRLLGPNLTDSTWKAWLQY